MFNGAELTLTGKLLEMNDRWVAVEKLESGRVEYWMPRETVFFVRVTRPKEKSGNASETTADYSASDDPASSSRPATEMRVRWHSGMM